MNCAWCGANADDSGSHGICEECSSRMELESAVRQWNRVPSMAEVNAAKFAQECDELLESELTAR